MMGRDRELVGREGRQEIDKNGGGREREIMWEKKKDRMQMEESERLLEGGGERVRIGWGGNKNIRTLVMNFNCIHRQKANSVHPATRSTGI